ncbi:MAG: CocE/NonD family hydrolase C-terminal non-catalytic domain-containing protein, partial [Longimicrobiales bacterium]|nr:CocE/NonD family hydrolase C-terminal non-catalytic domain-containing protein [Longimicrobiales bacterium]
DRPAANLSVWLVSLPWDAAGDDRRTPPTANIVTRGWADPQNRNTLGESEPLVPGEFVTLAFDLQPDDQVVPAGQRLGLMIFSSDREFTLWADPGTGLTLDLEATRLALPIVGGAPALERAIGR